MLVVGVDGSAASRDALRWTVEEALRRDAGVRAVYAWTAPVASPRGFIPRELLDPEFLREAAWHRLQETLDEVAVGTAELPPIELLPCPGHPETVLVAASAGADMLVLGAPSRGALGEAVHGSVTRACVRHASCPVVVVPAPVRVAA